MYKTKTERLLQKAEFLAITIFTHHFGCRLDRPIHLSYDIDSLDPIVSPSTGTAGSRTASVFFDLLRLTFCIDQLLQTLLIDDFCFTYMLFCYCRLSKNTMLLLTEREIHTRNYFIAI